MSRKVKDLLGRGTYSARTYAEAVDIQNRLSRRLVTRAPRRTINTVAGADVGFDKTGQWAIAGIAVFEWPGLDLVDIALAASRVEFPYIPGLLSFREIPALVRAFLRLDVLPDLVFCDGQGRAHPRRFGLACHLGVVLGLPTIGCAKSILVGEHGAVGARRGSRAALVDAGEVVGTAVRTRDNVKPIYVSAGNMMDLDSAAEMVLAAGRGYRVPEPTRFAHTIVARAKAAQKKKGR
jgi:deoxyribonuclease V